MSVAGWACECVCKVKCFLTLPSSDVFLSRDAAQVLWHPAPFAPVVSLASDAYFVGQGSSAGVRMEKAEGSSVVSTGTVLSGSTKDVCVPRVSGKGRTPPDLPSEISFRSPNKASVHGFAFVCFFQVGCVMYLVPLMKTKLRVERVYPGGGGRESKNAFLRLANPKPREGLLFFLSYPAAPGTRGALTRLGRGKATSF